MRHRTACSFALIALACVAIACGGDRTDLTAPDIDNFGVATAAAKPQSGTFDVAVTGDVNSGGVTKESNATRLNSTQVVARAMPLDLSFFANEATIPGGSNCFGAFSGNGALAIKLEKKNSPTKAVASYFFEAFGKDGTTEIAYQLQMFGTIAGDWLPKADGTPSTVALDSWEMKFDTKGGKKKACTGSGAFNSTITVTRKS